MERRSFDAKTTDSAQFCSSLWGSCLQSFGLLSTRLITTRHVDAGKGLQMTAVIKRQCTDTVWRTSHPKHNITCCFYGCEIWRHVSPKRRCLPTGPHGATTQTNDNGRLRVFQKLSFIELQRNEGINLRVVPSQHRSSVQFPWTKHLPIYEMKKLNLVDFAIASSYYCIASGEA
jgi:hypothetical protein